MKATKTDPLPSHRASSATSGTCASQPAQASRGNRLRGSSEDLGLSLPVEGLTLGAAPVTRRQPAESEASAELAARPRGPMLERASTRDTLGSATSSRPTLAERAARAE